MRTREEVVAEARSWIRTPYHLAADVKGAGVDCAMLVLRVYADLGMIEPFDPRPYSSDWMLHRSEEIYLKLVQDRAREIAREDALPGDVVLFKVARCYAHGGIITSVKPLRMVHAYKNARMVIEEIIENNAEITNKLGTAKFASYWAK